MALGVSPDTLIELVGHDGLKLVRPLEPSNLKYRGFHPQEILDVAYSTYFASFRYVEVNPYIGTASVNEAVFSDKSLERLMKQVCRHEGVFVGLNEKGLPHAVAFDSNGSEDIQIYDPTGPRYSLIEQPQRFFISEAYVLC